MILTFFMISVFSCYLLFVIASNAILSNGKDRTRKKIQKQTRIMHRKILRMPRIIPAFPVKMRSLELLLYSGWSRAQNRGASLERRFVAPPYVVA